MSIYIVFLTPYYCATREIRSAIYSYREVINKFIFPAAMQKYITLIFIYFAKVI